VHRAALCPAFDDEKLGAEGGLQAVTSNEAVRVDGCSQRIFGEHKPTRGDDPILECLMCLRVCAVKARGDDGDGAGDGVEEGTGEGASSDASGGDVVDEADGMNAPQR